MFIFISFAKLKNQQPSKIIADRLNFSVLAWVHMFDIKINRELIACHLNLVRVPMESVTSNGLDKTILLKNTLTSDAISLSSNHYPYKA